jgi:DNA-binding MurR/RpiR family transcriptional regulator
MNTMNSPVPLSDLVAAVNSELTPAERLIAEEVLAEPTLLAFGTVSDLADRVGTSRPTIVRFANQLGFKGYTPLQQHVRRRVSLHLARPSERIRQSEKMSLPVRKAIDRAIASVFDVVGEKRFERLARLVAEANKVWVLSGETSQAGALAFHSRLSMVRPDVYLLRGRSISADLGNAVPGDTAVVFDFYRYRRQVVETARILADAGVDMVVITDGPLSPLAGLTDNWVAVDVPGIGPFDSSVPVVAIAELLVSRVAKQLQQQATARIDRIEAVWEETDEFLKE